MGTIKLAELLMKDIPVFWSNQDQLDLYDGSESTRTVVSVIGKESMGKSTIMNQIADTTAFYVEKDESTSIDKTTRGIDMYDDGERLFLDTEGVGNITCSGHSNYEHMLLTISTAISNIIVVLVSFNDRNDSGGFFINFLKDLFSNSIDLIESPKTLIILIKDKKPNEGIRDKFMETVHREWKNALNAYLERKKQVLNINSCENEEQDEVSWLEHYFRIEVQFAVFDHEQNKYAEVYVKQLKNYVFQSNDQFTLAFISKTMRYLTSIFNSTPLDSNQPILIIPKSYPDCFYQDIDTYKTEFLQKCRQLKDSFDGISNIDSNLLRLQSEFERKLVEKSIPKPIILKTIYIDCLDELKEVTGECLDLVILFSICDIHYYNFKLSCANLKYTFFEKYAYESKMREHEEILHILIEDIEPPRFITDRIFQKQTLFKNKMLKMFRKDVAVDALVNIGTIAFGGLLGGLAAGFRIFAYGVRIGTIAGIWGASITGLLLKSMINMKEEGLHELNVATEALMEQISSAKGSGLVIDMDQEIATELEQQQMPIQSVELENKIMKGENN